MKRRQFTFAAQSLWAAIPPAARERILEHVFCTQCGTSRRIVDYTGTAEHGDIHLRGFCVQCGHVVVRVVETSETPT